MSQVPAITRRERPLRCAEKSRGYEAAVLSCLRSFAVDPGTVDSQLPGRPPRRSSTGPLGAPPAAPPPRLTPAQQERLRQVLVHPVVERARRMKRRVGLNHGRHLSVEIPVMGDGLDVVDEHVPPANPTPVPQRAFFGALNRDRPGARGRRRSTSRTSESGLSCLGCGPTGRRTCAPRRVFTAPVLGACSSVRIAQAARQLCVPLKDAPGGNDKPTGVVGRENRRRGRLRLEFRARYPALTNDREQRPDLDLGMIGYRDRRRTVGGAALHHDMAPAAPDLDEPVTLENLAHFASRQDAKPTHSMLRTA